MRNDENTYNLDFTLEIIGQPENGNVDVYNNDSLLTYRPNLDYVGNDTVTYRIFADVDANVADTAILVITVDEFVGIKKVSQNSEFLIYPNPASDFVAIVFSSEKAVESEVSIFDYTGKNLYSERMEIKDGLNIHKLNAETLPGGLYFINIRTSEKTVTKRIIIQK